MITMRLSLRVNGKNYNVEAEPGTPLLYILRNDLGLNGPKYGCGLQQCGACMVLLDGVAGPSCMIPVSSVAKKSITTLEGLAKGDKLQPVQQAFIDEQAAQCGYCLNGMVISAVSLLDQHPNSTAAQISDGMKPCLCRCGTQSRAIRAIKKVSKQ